MADEVHVKLVHLAIRHALLECRLGRDGISARRYQAKPDRDAMHVRVHRKERPIEREEEHARRGLRPDAGKSHERLPESRIGHVRERTVIERHAALPDAAQHRTNADSLRRSESATTNRARERRKWRVGDLIPVSEAATQIRIRAVPVGVAGVLREHREDELFERREVSGWWRCAIRLRKATRDGAETPPVHDPSVSGIAGRPTTLG